MAVTLGTPLFQTDHCRVEVPLTLSSQTLSFNLYRKNSLDNFSAYDTITIPASSYANSVYYFYDYIVEPGVSYQYSTTTTFTNPTTVFIDSTGSFILGPSNKQLNFIYNSEISDFKEIRRDSVVETLGGSYPFVIRNSNVKYSQFGFSGLIVSNIDTALSLGGTDYSSSLSPFAIEKFFRKNVISFLNDGLPKLFKSDTEGMFLGRITDVSLSSVQETGRVLYSVSFTFTEIADNTINNLRSNNILNETIGSRLTTSYSKSYNGSWG